MCSHARFRCWRPTHCICLQSPGACLRRVEVAHARVLVAVYCSAIATRWKLPRTQENASTWKRKFDLRGPHLWLRANRKTAPFLGPPGGPRNGGRGGRSLRLSIQKPPAAPVLGPPGGPKNGAVFPFTLTPFPGPSFLPRVVSRAVIFKRGSCLWSRDFSRSKTFFQSAFSPLSACLRFRSGRFVSLAFFQPVPFAAQRRNRGRFSRRRKYRGGDGHGR